MLQQLERIAIRLVLVVAVVLGKHAHADLGEGRLGQRCQRLLLERIALQVPHIGGGADIDVAGAVGIAEMVACSETRTGPWCPGWAGPTVEAARNPVERGNIARRLIAPFAFGIGQKPELVGALAIVETVHPQRPLALAESGFAARRPETDCRQTGPQGSVR